MLSLYFELITQNRHIYRRSRLSLAGAPDDVTRVCVVREANSYIVYRVYHTIIPWSGARATRWIPAGFQLSEESERPSSDFSAVLHSARESLIKRPQLFFFMSCFFTVWERKKIHYFFFFWSSWWKSGRQWVDGDKQQYIGAKVNYFFYFFDWYIGKCLVAH